MHYTVNQLAQLTGLTPRTLRYYDAVGLLRPARDESNDYRLYTGRDVDRLQQILLYREMGLPLEKIRRVLDAPGYDRAEALWTHLGCLLAQRQQVEALIRTVSRTLETLEGDTDMNDKEKFEGMKQRVLQENEAAYGQEARERYGDKAVSESARRLGGMTEEQWDRMQSLESGYQNALRRAMEAADPAGADAQEACRLHRDWLLCHWAPEMLTPERHIGLVAMYGQDQRFQEYYDRVAPGSAAFFDRAIRSFYGKED